jgi:hypothetical protein
MAEQIQSLSSLLPEAAPFRETFRQADVLIADLKASGYKEQADDYRNSIISQVQLGKMARNPQEVKAIADNIQNIFGGLKSLSKTSLEKQQQNEPYSVLTPQEEVQLFGRDVEEPLQRQGKGGKIEPIAVRNYASPQESFRLEQLKAADQSLSDVKKQAESFLKVTPELNQLGRLLDAGIQTGKFQNLVLPLKQFAEDVGFPVGDVANQEQFRALSGQLALTFGQQLKGSMSDGDRALLVDRISPSVATSPEGNKMIIAFYKAGAEKNKKIRNAILQGRKKGLDPYEIEENVNEIVDSDFIADQVKTQFPQLQEQGQQATQPPAINYTPDAQNALERARALQQKK